MDARELAGVRERLEAFAGEVFEPLPRRDQREKGATYLRGLLLDGRRKSMQPMAQHLGVDHQRLQQFVISSTWDVEPVRTRLAARAVEVVGPDAWVVDDTGFPKDETASPGVARRYSGTLGKVGKCQMAVSVHAVTDPRRPRWTGGCSSRRGGTPRPPRPAGIRRPPRWCGTVEPAPESPTMWGTSGSGGWPWT